MDRGAWRATVHGVTNVGHDWVTTTHNILTHLLFFCPKVKPITLWQVAAVKCCFITTKSVKIRGRLRILPSNNSLVKHIACSLGREESTSTQMSQRESDIYCCPLWTQAWAYTIWGHLPTGPEEGAKHFHFQNKVAWQGENLHNVIEIIRNQDRDSACSFLIIHTYLILLLFSLCHFILIVGFLKLEVGEPLF